MQRAIFTTTTTTIMINFAILLDVHFKSGSPEMDKRIAPRRNQKESGSGGEGGRGEAKESLKLNRTNLSRPTVELWSRNYSSEFILTQVRLLGSLSPKSAIG